MDKLIQKLQAEVSKFGEVTTTSNPKKITFSHHSLFAQINLGPNELKVEFITPSLIKHSRLAKIEQIKADKFRHTVLISKDSDIDPQVLGWLRIAHATN